MSGAHGMSGSAAARNKRPLTIVFFTTLAYLVAEVVGGWWTGSLALLADAGHMLTDVAGVGLALLAIRFGEKPATPQRTFGYYRFEILAALTNAVVLILISIYILYEAYFRFLNPPKVESGTMMWVAGVGMAVNLYGVFLLRKSSGESLNMKGAYFEVLSDLLTSVGVLIAGVIMITTKWYYADPLLSAGIGLFILPRTWALLKESVNVLLEGTPADHAPGPAASARRGRCARPARLGAHFGRECAQRPRGADRRSPPRRRAHPHPRLYHDQAPHSARHHSGGARRLRPARNAPVSAPHATPANC
jgi:cobalt-zinc-cadmium efflux system protein